MQKILVIEDEPDIAELIAFNLKRHGFEAVKALDGIAGTELALREMPALIILDVMLPGRDGYSVFRDLRRDPRTIHTPVIMLTARAQAEDRIQGLEAGADDYLTKPFSPKELILRVQAVLKRSAAVATTASNFTYGPFRFDKNALTFYVEKEPVSLSGTEFKLMLFLCERAGKAQERNDLMRTIWGYSNEVYSRTIDSHITRLRKKLGSYGNMLETIRGTGFCIAALPK